MKYVHTTKTVPKSLKLKKKQKQTLGQFYWKRGKNVSLFQTLMWSASLWENYNKYNKNKVDYTQKDKMKKTYWKDLSFLFSSNSYGQNRFNEIDSTMKNGVLALNLATIQIMSFLSVASLSSHKYQRAIMSGRWG